MSGSFDPERWEASILAFEAADRAKRPAPGGVVFVGCATIAGWDLAACFPGLPAVNRGLDGARLEHLAHDCRRLVWPCQPRAVVVSAGEDDLAAGLAPGAVCAAWRSLADQIHALASGPRILYLGIKPSPGRWELIDQIREANRLIRESVRGDRHEMFLDVEHLMLRADGKPRRELYLADGERLSPRGYSRWTALVAGVLVVPLARPKKKEWWRWRLSRR